MGGCVSKSSSELFWARNRFNAHLYDLPTRRSVGFEKVRRLVFPVRRSARSNTESVSSIRVKAASSDSRPKTCSAANAPPRTNRSLEVFISKSVHFQICTYSTHAGMDNPARADGGLTGVAGRGLFEAVCSFARCSELWPTGPIYEVVAYRNQSRSAVSSEI